MSGSKVHYPRPPLSDGSPSTRTDIEPPVVISYDGVQIGDVFLPGNWIVGDAVTVRPGCAELTRSGQTRVEPATVTVTFMVGDIDIDQDAIDHVQLQQRLVHAIGIALSAPDGAPDPVLSRALYEELGKLQAMNVDPTATAKDRAAQLERVYEAYDATGPFPTDVDAVSRVD